MNRHSTGAFTHPQQPRFARHLAGRFHACLSSSVRAAARVVPGLAALAAFVASTTPAKADVILHAFNWRYDTVEARA
ncbi:MAG: hypothetical protein ACOVKS_02440, partial [Aquimonas sp.]